MPKTPLLVLLFFISGFLFGQSPTSISDSIRTSYHIPSLACAVVSSDSIFEMDVSGVRKINTDLKAGINDRFRIGSNTKAITGFIAARLVKEGKINWNTPFLVLFPELKARANKAYHQLTLLQLLTFRTQLLKWTYTNQEPDPTQFTGSEEQQRYDFAQWFLIQKPVQTKDSINFSNLGYVLGGMMLEKASGKSYKVLVTELGNELGINFGLGAPNETDSLQTWGHDASLNPEAPASNPKLNWLLAAGNINLTLADYCKFIQLQLAGLQGKSTLLSKEEFEFLHFGLYRFSLGWFNAKDENGNIFSYNIGNPGTFLSKVYAYPDLDKAIIILCNAQTPESDNGTEVLLDYLRDKHL